MYLCIIIPRNFNIFQIFHNKYPIPQILRDILHLISQDYELLNDFFQKKTPYMLFLYSGEW